MPISGGFLVFIFGVLVLFDAVPYTTELPFNTWKVSPVNDAFFGPEGLQQYGRTFPDETGYMSDEAIYMYPTVHKYAGVPGEFPPAYCRRLFCLEDKFPDS